MYHLVTRTRCRVSQAQRMMNFYNSVRAGASHYRLDGSGEGNHRGRSCLPPTKRGRARRSAALGDGLQVQQRGLDGSRRGQGLLHGEEMAAVQHHGAALGYALRHGHAHLAHFV